MEFLELVDKLVENVLLTETATKIAQQQTTDWAEQKAKEEADRAERLAKEKADREGRLAKEKAERDDRAAEKQTKERG